ncbi:MAG: hypothetical protein JWO82_3010 [Akkermansiaceae bacterium]|nr:hypothetical protein [Akkermansiaceae bacterium]
MFGWALIAAGALSLVSCNTVVTTTTASRLPVEKRAVLESSLTSAQRHAILDYANARYGGGFEKGWAQGAVLISVNGQPGTHRGRDPRGAYSPEPFRWTVNCESGHLDILCKSPFYFDSNPAYDDLLKFEARPGHHYSITSAYKNTTDNVRWVSVVYDRTEDHVVPISGLKPKTGPLPASAKIGPQDVMVLPLVHL